MFPGADFAWLPLSSPGLVSIPLAFVLGVVGTFVGRGNPEDPCMQAEIEVRSLTVVGVETAVTQRTRRRAAESRNNPRRGGSPFRIRSRLERRVYGRGGRSGRSGQRHPVSPVRRPCRTPAQSHRGKAGTTSAGCPSWNAPLDPGGTAHDRVRALVAALADFKLENRYLMLALEGGNNPYAGTQKPGNRGRAGRQLR